MIQNYSIWRVLRPFFDDPLPKEGFTVRWIAKKIELAPLSVKIHLDKLTKARKEGYPLVIKSNGVSYPTYRANHTSELFRFYKKMDLLFRLEESGLIKILGEKLVADTVVLFGSASKGEDVRESDIDLFLLSEEKDFDLRKYEDQFKRKISLHFSDDFSKLPKELRNNIANGIILRGYLKVF